MKKTSRSAIVGSAWYIQGSTYPLLSQVPRCQNSFALPYHLVWVPAPSPEEEGSGTLRIVPHTRPYGIRGATIECELIILTCRDVEWQQPAILVLRIP